jgi:hypothetical protein
MKRGVSLLNIRRTIFLVFAVAVYSSCTSSRPLFLFSAEPRLADRDFSFAVTGEAVETKSVASVIVSRGNLPTILLPEADIVLKGQIYRPWYDWGTVFGFRLVKLKNQGNDAVRIYWLPSYRQRWFWKGSVTADGYTTNVSIEFYVYADSGGNNKHFLLRKAALGEVRLEFEDPFDISTHFTEFPFLGGYVHTANNIYRVWAVLDNDPDKDEFRNAVFFNPLQKFQFLDEQDTVITELEKNRYTVYDTASESEKESLQNAVALLAAFRHAATVMRNLEDSWDPSPAFYWYVFPEGRELPHN